MNPGKINSKYFDRKDNTFVLKHSIKEPPIETKYKIVDCKGVEHNVYITKRNFVYFLDVDKNGNDVKRKVSKEISNIILKELGRIKE